MTAPGQNDECHIMLSNVSEFSLARLLELCNKILEESKLPVVWKEAVIVPIKKPGMFLTSPDNYRPIALTSHERPGNGYRQISLLYRKMSSQRCQHFRWKLGKCLFI